MGLRKMIRLPAALFALIAVLHGVACAESIEQKAEVCAACHGANGVPQQKDIPVIWGQQLDYLFVALGDFRSGARKSDVMSPVAGGLDHADLAPLATYFSQKVWPDLQQPRASAEVATPAQRVSASAFCTSCHQEGFKGDSTQPRLSGQSREYLLKAMTDFRSGVRANNPRMMTLMKSMSDADTEALATYLAGL
jgi:cytochrome c553